MSPDMSMPKKVLSGFCWASNTEWFPVPHPTSKILVCSPDVSFKNTELKKEASDS